MPDRFEVYFLSATGAILPRAIARTPAAACAEVRRLRTLGHVAYVLYTPGDEPARPRERDEPCARAMS